MKIDARPRWFAFALAVAFFAPLSPARADLAAPATGLVSAGASHTLSLRSDGTVWAWGRNESGQLGDGTVTLRTTPVQVKGLSGVTAIAAGRSHSLALTNDGKVWAWGDNSSGELGDGTTVLRPRPVQVHDLANVIAIAAGGRNFSLALKSDGTVSAWGDNYFGQLGDDTRTPRLRPVTVNHLAQVTQISAGSAHALALRRDGAVYAWGWNVQGQLGDGTQLDRQAPVSVKGVSDAVAVTAGTLTHSLALLRDGTVLAWGNNYSGQMADDLTIPHLTPAPVRGLSGIATIAAGSSHNLAQARDGAVWVWGSNMSGQLNLLAPADRVKPTHPDSWPDEAVAVSTGGNQTVVLDRAGHVLTLGSNQYGQWGDGTQATLATSLGGQAEALDGLVDASAMWIGGGKTWHEARDFVTTLPVASDQPTQ